MKKHHCNLQHCTRKWGFTTVLCNLEPGIASTVCICMDANGVWQDCSRLMMCRKKQQKRAPNVAKAGNSGTWETREAAGTHWEASTFLGCPSFRHDLWWNEENVSLDKGGCNCPGYTRKSFKSFESSRRGCVCPPPANARNISVLGLRDICNRLVPIICRSFPMKIYGQPNRFAP